MGTEILENLKLIRKAITKVSAILLILGSIITFESSYLLAIRVRKRGVCSLGLKRRRGGKEEETARV